MSELHRAHELICKIGADTKEALVSELLQFARRIERDEMSHGIIGGSDCGAIYSYRHDPNMTHDHYFLELQTILDREQGRVGE